MFDWVINLFTTRTPSKPQSQPQPVAPEPPVPEFVLAARREAEVQRQESARLHALAVKQRNDQEARKKTLEQERLKKLEADCYAFLSQPAQLQQMERNLSHSIKGSPETTRWDFTEVLRNTLSKAGLFSSHPHDDPDHRHAMAGAVRALAPHFKAKGIIVEPNDTSTYSYRSSYTSGQYDTEHTTTETGTRRGVTFRW
ncbi:MAG: hypothetical protein EOP36_19075 [Rubrivivax sp.]|nr:MAG: hypothetical protein EOP36_19075 [Rubrivivax sp.]